MSLFLELIWYNENTDILILGEGPTQGSDDTALTAEAKYPINFTQLNKRFVLSLHYHGSSSFVFANATKTYKFKAEDSEIKYYALFLGNISKTTGLSRIKRNCKIFFCWI